MKVTAWCVKWWTTCLLVNLTVKVPRRIPEGEVISRVEAPRGELLYFLKSNGSDKPERVKVRTPSLCNWASVLVTAVGHNLADMPMILAGIDPCFSCNDRIVTVIPQNGFDPDGLGRPAAIWNRVLQMNINFPPISLHCYFSRAVSFCLLSGLVFEYIDRKLVARFQNRYGPRWFQPLADVVKLLAKEEIIPTGVNKAPVRRPAHDCPDRGINGCVVCAAVWVQTGFQLSRRPDRHPLPA